MPLEALLTATSLVTRVLRWLICAAIVIALGGWMLVWPIGMMASHHSDGGALLFTFQAASSCACLVLLTLWSRRRWLWLVSAFVVVWAPALMLLLGLTN